MVTGFDITIARDNDALFASPAAIAGEYRAQGQEPKPVKVIMGPLEGGRDLRGGNRPQRRNRVALIRASDMPPGRPEPLYQDKLFDGTREWTVLQPLGHDFGVIEFQVEYGPSKGF